MSAKLNRFCARCDSFNRAVTGLSVRNRQNAVNATTVRSDKIVPIAPSDPIVRRVLTDRRSDPSGRDFRNAPNVRNSKANLNIWSTQKLPNLLSHPSVLKVTSLLR